jgi:predicted HAD superfamily hydrolase
MNINKTNWLQIMRNFYESEDYDVVLKLQHKDYSKEAQKLIELAKEKYEELFCYGDES